MLKITCLVLHRKALLKNSLDWVGRSHHFPWHKLFLTLIYFTFPDHVLKCNPAQKKAGGGALGGGEREGFFKVIRMESPNSAQSSKKPQTHHFREAHKRQEGPKAQDKGRREVLVRDNCGVAAVPCIAVAPRGPAGNYICCPALGRALAARPLQKQDLWNHRRGFCWDFFFFLFCAELNIDVGCEAVVDWGIMDVNSS